MRPPWKPCRPVRSIGPSISRSSRPAKRGRPRTTSHRERYAIVIAMAERLRRPPRRSRAEKKAETRRRLIDAAARVFARRGFHGAGVDEVAADAGVTTGALYWHFKTKEELFLALADERVTRRVEEIADVDGSRGEPLDLEADIERQFKAFIEREPEWPLLYYEFWAYGARDARLRGAFTERRRRVQMALAEAIEHRARSLDVQLPVASEQVAIGMNALMNGLALERVADEAAVPDGLAGLLMSRFLLGIVTGPRP